MSTDTETTRTITLTEHDDGWWTARDLEHEISAQGATREEALENLDTLVAALDGEAGREPTDEELRALGIDPADNKAGRGDLPDVLK